MRKDGLPTTVTANSVGKMFICFETRPLLATLLALTLVMVIWNLQPYYENILSATRTSSCSAATSTNASLSYKTATSSFTGKKVASATTSSSNNNDPNKHQFHSYGNTAALFVQMGAYRGGPKTFAVIGLVSKPIHVFGHPWYKCEWISNNGSSIKAKSYKMLPDWGYGRVYTVVTRTIARFCCNFYNCLE